MAHIRGCNIPENLYYWPEKHVWARPEEDGTVTVGITDVAQNMARGIINAMPKGVGKKVKRGRSLGTLESGKWVGPVTSPVTGEIVAVNEEAVANPKLINDDPYGKGWFARIRPDNWEAEKAQMVTGPEGVERYAQFLSQEGIGCEE